MSEAVGSNVINREKIAGAISDMLSQGYGLTEEVFPEPVIDQATREMDGLRFMLPDEGLRGNGFRRSIYLKPRGLIEAVFLSGRPVPTLASMGEQLEEVVRAEGAERGIPQLADWSANKAVINKMPGTEAQPAIIKGHTDPHRFRGLLIVVGFETALLEINEEEPEPVGVGSLEAFIGKDLAKELRIRQPHHSITTTKKRYSTAFSNDTVPPLTLKNIFLNVLKVRPAA